MESVFELSEFYENLLSEIDTPSHPTSFHKLVEFEAETRRFHSQLGPAASGAQTGRIRVAPGGGQPGAVRADGA
eukprot:8917620-Pyramimonas_sp.AAC.1